jgi:small subunit ribosomal protein S13
MARIAGREIPDVKKVKVALTYIYGVGDTTALKILDATGIDPEKKAGQLSDDELSLIATTIDKSHEIEGALRRQVAQNVARLRKINCYRGLRHSRGLPVRGQRTKTNARTRKGKRKTVAGKRGVKDQR